jgi:outer membrane protein assembly factor BamB
MAQADADRPSATKPLRVWPGVVLAALVLLLRYGLPLVSSDRTQLAVLAGLAGGPLIILWWLLFSRAPWLERLGALAVMAGVLFATRLVVHESIAEGAMGFLFYLLAVPTMALAFVAAAWAARRQPPRQRRLALLAGILVGCGAWSLIRTGGFTGNFEHDFHWRWTPTPEERLLAQGEDEPQAAAPTAGEVPAPAGAPPATAAAPAYQGAPPAAPAADLGAAPPAAPAAAPVDARAQVAAAEPAAAPPAAVSEPPAAEWPGFRGPRRDGVVRGLRIATDWSASPPVELWRRPVGPGWSSFAVDGARLFTQEQRGDDEVVACYDLRTGEPVWRHRDAARFWESNGGAGPRGTPTLHGGRVYALGATGILNALDARDGAVLWTRNAAADTKVEVPGWGFSSSPVVIDDVVIVATAGKLAAYDARSGQPRWYGPDGGDGYSSPHRVTVDGVTQVLFLSANGAIAVAPADGKVLWEHSWKSGPRIVQPALTADGDVLVGAGDAVRRVALTPGGRGWTVEERWTSNGLKPYFNDFVIHDGHAYGFDGRLLAAIDLRDGTRKWKGGRYGSGQLVLLAEQGLLLVISEAGELALVRAAPDQFTELARAPAIQGKTWNHPVVVGDVLLVRNGEEMAAFRLAFAGGDPQSVAGAR